MPSVSYTQRTLQALRDQGFVPAMVERHLARVGSFGIKQDLFGLLDILAFKPGCPQWRGIQSTGPNGYSSHMATIVHNRHTDGILSTGTVSIELWCWKDTDGWWPDITVITPELLARVRAENRYKKPAKDAGIPECPA